MKTLNRAITGLISIILILVSIALFFMLTEKRVLIDWLGFAFIIAAELIFMVSLLFLQSERGSRELTVLYPGVSSAGGVYTILVIIVSVIYMVFFREGAKYLLLVQIVLFAVYLIAIALIFNVSHHVGKANTAALNSVNKMQELLNRIVTLQNANRDGALGQKLNKLYDAIRFCDVSATVTTDEVIAAKLAELQILVEDKREESVEAAGALVDDIMVLVKQRATEMSILKSGGL